MSTRGVGMPTEHDKAHDRFWTPARALTLHEGFKRLLEIQVPELSPEAFGEDLKAGGFAFQPSDRTLRRLIEREARMKPIVHNSVVLAACRQKLGAMTT